MEHLTEAVIISGFSSRLSGYELYDHFRKISRSGDYIFLYAILNTSQSAAKYYRYEPAARGSIVLDIDIGAREGETKFLLQLGAMEGNVSNRMLHMEKEKIVNVIRSFRGIHLHDSLEHINGQSQPSKPFFIWKDTAVPSQG